MTAIRRADLLRRFGSWEPSIRLILLAGPDESSSRELAQLAAKALADPADPMAITDIAADELKSDPGKLADEAASVSMFGGARLIRVAGAGESTQEAVRLLLAAPVAGDPVVMLAGDLAKSSALRKLAEDSPLALALISYPLEGRDLANWLQSHAKELGLRLESGIAERLMASSDGDTGVLASELAKYALFLDSSPETPKTLERAHVAALGADSAEDDMNLLVAAIVSGNAAAAERQYRLLAGSSAIPALRAIARRLLQLAEARAAVDGGAQPLAAVKALRPPIFWKEQDSTAAALRDWPQPRIRRALAAMLAGEQAIKQPNGPGDTAGWHAILALGMGREKP
ncbi:DNA polymerase III subunit delta [Sandaracinobacter neustonicus]|nr:DNA polymerase III subunit delta [Sandaracinobacter neustonicus]